MPFRHFTDRELELVRAWKLEGRRPAEIAELLGRHISTIVRHFQRLSRGRAAKRQPTGRPPSLTQRQVDQVVSTTQRLVKEAKAQWQVTAAMVRQALRLKCSVLHERGITFRPMRQKPLRTTADEHTRLEWGKKYAPKRASFWSERVHAYLDNKFFPVYPNHKARCYAAKRATGTYRARGEGLGEGHVRPRKTLKVSWGKSVNVAVALSAQKVLMCHVVEGHWNAAEACRMYARSLGPALRRASPELDRFVVLEDNDPSGYKSRAARDTKVEQRISVLEIPKRSPDVNPLDYGFWAHVNERLRVQESRFGVNFRESRDHFVRRLRRTILRTHPAFLRSLVTSMKRRAVALVAAKGRDFEEKHMHYTHVRTTSAGTGTRAGFWEHILQVYREAYPDADGLRDEHHHCPVYCSKRHYWKRVADISYQKYKVKLHAATHDGYYTMYSYITAPTTKKPLAVGRGDALRQLLEAGAIAARALNGRQHKQQAEEAPQRAPQKRFRSGDIFTLMEEHNLQNVLDLQGLANSLAQQGNPRLAQFCTSMGEDRLGQLLNAARGVMEAPTRVAMRQHSRLDTLRDAAMTSPCTCSGVWAPAALRTLTNNQEDVRRFCQDVCRALQLGARRGVNLAIVGVPGSGKSMLLEPLDGIFQVMGKPEARSSFPLAGALDAQVLLWQDYKHQDQTVLFEDLLSLTVGEMISVRVPHQKNQTFRNVAPLFYTSNFPLQVRRPDLEEATRLNQAMAERFCTRQWKMPLPEAERIPDLPRCSRCCAAFYLANNCGAAGTAHFIVRHFQRLSRGRAAKRQPTGHGCHGIARCVRKCSVKTIRKVLHERGITFRPMRQKPLRTTADEHTRLEWGKKYAPKRASFWSERVHAYLDNKFFPVYPNHKARCYAAKRATGTYRARGEGLGEGHVRPRKTLKVSWGKSVNVAVALSAQKVLMCHVVEGHWNAAEACRMYARSLGPALRRASPELDRFVVLEDNDPSGYKSRAARDTKVEQRISVLEIPKRSPDVNPLDYGFWAHVNERLRVQESRFGVNFRESRDHFVRRLRRTILRTHPAFLRSLVTSMKRRAVALVAAKGRDFEAWFQGLALRSLRAWRCQWQPLLPNLASQPERCFECNPAERLADCTALSVDVQRKHMHYTHVRTTSAGDRQPSTFTRAGFWEHILQVYREAYPDAANPTGSIVQFGAVAKERHAASQDGLRDEHHHCPVYCSKRHYWKRVADISYQKYKVKLHAATHGYYTMYSYITAPTTKKPLAALDAEVFLSVDHPRGDALRQLLEAGAIAARALNGRQHKQQAEEAPQRAPQKRFRSGDIFTLMEEHNLQNVLDLQGLANSLAQQGNPRLAQFCTSMGEDRLGQLLNAARGVMEAPTRVAMRQHSRLDTLRDAAMTSPCTCSGVWAPAALRTLTNNQEDVRRFCQDVCRALQLGARGASISQLSTSQAAAKMLLEPLDGIFQVMGKPEARSSFPLAGALDAQVLLWQDYKHQDQTVLFEDLLSLTVGSGEMISVQYLGLQVPPKRTRPSATSRPSSTPPTSRCRCAGLTWRRPRA
ncbi:unnamed protein product [Effrenium voratum]|uniref:Uncharacterized protein n=1 Tax=Effrenium voratum TaxID=2562239 RepID=A0AA36JHA1_9DINO|nr:unnamed protein product [Effrenium voratum]